MKKAIKINISGVVFHIDDDAYEKLKSYLQSVELYFITKEGGKEIVDDIEARIAELFQSRTTSRDQVITIKHVNEIIEIMGDPSVFVEEAEDAEDKADSNETKRITVRGSKRLYRDPDNSVLGGVCGGLGAYFGIDPVVIRILFVVLLVAGYGTWGIVYIILWIAVPKAVTISQRLEMRGERITVANIEKTVKEEYKGVKSRFKNIEKSEGYKQATSAVEEIFQVLGRIIVVLAKIVAILIGVVLVFAGFVLLMAFLGVFVFNFTPGFINTGIFPVSHFLSAIADPTSLTIMLVAMFFAIIIPLIAVIYGGIKLVFQLRTRDSGLGLVALIIWVISISVLFTMGIVEARKFTFRGTAQETVVITSPAEKTLYLELNEIVNRSSLNEKAWFGPHFRGIYFDRRREIFYSRPALSIQHTGVDTPELIIERSARGPSPLQAEKIAESIVYDWKQTDSTLIFNNLFTLEPGVSWKIPKLNLRLNLPDDYQVHLGERMEQITTSGETPERSRLKSVIDRNWKW
jgi:phage shock protein PspC (stress-responsive transcriptional regulator)